MEFLPINSIDDFRTTQIFKSYCNSFPEKERRSKKQFNQLFQTEKSKIFAIIVDLNFVGYIIVWELSKFVFLEHFEIFPEYRNQKYGAEVLEKLFHDYSKIVLESEPENLNELAQRRIGFYKRNGFTIVDEQYVQPPYDSSKNALNLFLLSNFPAENIEILKEEIYNEVYYK